MNLRTVCEVFRVVLMDGESVRARRWWWLVRERGPSRERGRDANTVENKDSLLRRGISRVISTRDTEDISLEFVIEAI